MTGYCPRCFREQAPNADGQRNYVCSDCRRERPRENWPPAPSDAAVDERDDRMHTGVEGGLCQS